MTITCFKAKVNLSNLDFGDLKLKHSDNYGSHNRQRIFEGFRPALRLSGDT